MNLLSQMRTRADGLSCEQIIALCEPSIGLAGFIVIDNTTRGPATGGIRIFPYLSEQDALEDGLRLARAMTFKNAAAELPAGGGKVVLLAGEDINKKHMLQATGRIIQSLGGRFLAGRDVGVSLEDAHIIRQETEYMVDESENGLGDLNRHTALGVIAGAAAALQHRSGQTDWRGIRVAIQGVGGVGTWLARELSSRGAHLVVADTQPERLIALRDQIDFEEVAPHEIMFAKCDLLSPCAVGAVVHEGNVADIRAHVVAGSANNILASSRAGEELHRRKIVYAPDYLINAGAVIAGTHFLRFQQRRGDIAPRAIGEKTRGLLRRASQQDLPPEKLLSEETLRRLGCSHSWSEWYWPG